MTGGLRIRGLSVRAGRTEVVHRVDLDVPAGAVTGLIGPNGAGKTTVLDAVSGMVPSTGGTIVLGGAAVDRLPAHRRARLGLARTFQSQELFEDLSVGENLLVAGAGAAQDDRMPAELSHAQRSQLALDRALAGRPSVLLLDEPAAGLDDEGRRALARRLRDVAAAGTAVLLVDHDMDLVLDVCDRVTVLDAGRVVAEGPPTHVRTDETVVAAYLGRAAPRRGGATLARPAAVAPVGDRLLDVRGLTAGYLGVPVVHDVSLSVGAGEVVALLGLNGAGKTTALLAVAGVLPRMGGQVTVLGDRTARPDRLAGRGLAAVRQGQTPFAGLTVAEHFRLIRNGDPDAALDRLPALRPLLDRQASVLSGGESRMLALALALSRRPKLLLVDELSLGLAPQVVEGLVGTVAAIAHEAGVGVLLVEQHPRLALAAADRGYLLERGRVIAEGPAGPLRRRFGGSALLPG